MDEVFDRPEGPKEGGETVPEKKPPVRPLKKVSARGVRFPVKNPAFMFLTVVVILLLAVVALTIRGRSSAPFDPSKWQAVFLTNNQVYFGHIREITRDYLVLKDTFYLRVVQPLQQGIEIPASAVSLVKLGSELHGPEDVMFIPKSTILFWENMRSNSQVVQAVTNFLKK